MCGRDPRGRRRDAGLAGEVADVADLVVGHERDDGAAVASAGGAAGAVQVGLVLGGRVGVAIDPRTRNVIVAGYASGGFDVGDGWGGDALGAYGVFVADIGRL